MRHGTGLADAAPVSRKAACEGESEARSREPAVASAVAAARAAWPQLRVDPRAFVAHLARGGHPIDRLRVGDLYLAFACAAGDPIALQELWGLLGDVAVRLRRRGASAAECDEVVQRLCEKLLTGAAPRILDYAGTGELASWLRVAALREAQNLRRQTHREDLIGAPDAIEAFACTGQEPASAHLAVESREVFVAAFRAGFATLSARERNLLRMHYVDRVEIGDLATAYAVHRVTVGRWLDSARDRLRREVERRLASRLEVGHSEVARLIGFVRGGPDLSLGRLLATITVAP